MWATYRSTGLEAGSIIIQKLRSALSIIFKKSLAHDDNKDESSE